MGVYPASEGLAQSGKTSVVRHSDAETGITWQTEFIGLTYAQWEDIKDHFQSYGTVYSFAFTTTTLPAAETPSGYKWWYTAEPSVTDVYTNLFNIQISFRCDLAPSFVAPTAFEGYFLRGATTDYSPDPATIPPTPTLSVESVANGVTTDGFVEVAGVAPGATWQSSTDGGSTWQTRAGSGFRLAAGDYSAGQVQVRQTDPGGTSAVASTEASVTVAPAGSAVVAVTVAAGATVTGTVELPAIGQLVWVRLGWPCWFTLYASAAAQSADVSRAATTEPAFAAGVCSDPRLAAGDSRLTGMHLNPFDDFKNEESPATNSYPWKLINEDTVSRDFRIILQYAS